jgi:Zn-finger protein
LPFLFLAGNRLVMIFIVKSKGIDFKKCKNCLFLMGA